MRRRIKYLLDVFYLACTAFGGPQAHISMMLKVFVQKRGYLTEKELIETYTFCQMLPGPSSSQTMTAISYKQGGILLAIVAFIIWILPAAILMTTFSLVLTSFEHQSVPTNFLRFILPMAVGFIAFAGFRIGKSVVRSNTGWMLVAASALLSILFNSPWVFPVVIILSSIVSYYTTRHAPPPSLPTDVNVRPRWRPLIIGLAIFLGILIAAAIIGGVTKYRPYLLFENFYRFGALTFGGGQVLVPMMFEQFVKHRHYFTAEEFISGYSLNQMVPGPTFSLSAFAGSMALKDMGTGYQLLGALIATVAIYLPGLLLTLLLFPLWEYIKHHNVIQRVLEGLNAASTGLILAAALTLLKDIPLTNVSMSIMIATFCVLQFTRVPAPVLVLGAILLGWISMVTHWM